MNSKLAYTLNLLVSFVVGTISGIVATKLERKITNTFFKQLMNFKIPLLPVIIFAITFIITFILFFKCITKKTLKKLSKKQKVFLKNNTLTDQANPNILYKWNAYFDDYNRPRITDLEIRCNKDSDFGVPLTLHSCPRSISCNRRNCEFIAYNHHQIKKNIESILDEQWDEIQNKSYGIKSFIEFIIICIILFFLIFGNIFFGLKYFSTKKKNIKILEEKKKIQTELEQVQTELQQTKIEFENTIKLFNGKEE